MNVIAKAAALCQGWRLLTGSDPPSRNAVLFCLAQADLETQAGDAWGGDKGPHDWGATDLRAPNAAEMAAIAAGTLKNGAWLHADGTSSMDRRPGDVGQLHTDSSPGGHTYSMWFAAFDDDAHGAEYFLKIVLRNVGDLFSDPNATLEEYVTRNYQHGYFEFIHPTAQEAANGMARARPIGKRVPPFTPAEAANIAGYLAGCQRCLASIAPALAGWVVPGGATGDAVASDTGQPVIAQPGDPVDGPAPPGPGWENNHDEAPDTQPPTAPPTDPPAPDPDATIEPS